MKFQLHMPHLGHHHHHHERKEKAHKGCMTVMVGREGEEQRRFVVPVAHLNHPLFAELLDMAEKEYGFCQKGVLAIPCGVDHFRHVQDIIGSESGDDDGLHRRRRQRQHSRHQIAHFAACFSMVRWLKIPEFLD